MSDTRQPDCIHAHLTLCEVIPGEPEYYRCDQCETKFSPRLEPLKEREIKVIYGRAKAD